MRAVDLVEQILGTDDPVGIDIVFDATLPMEVSGSRSTERNSRRVDGRIAGRVNCAAEIASEGQLPKRDAARHVGHPIAHRITDAHAQRFDIFEFGVEECEAGRNSVMSVAQPGDRAMVTHPTTGPIAFQAENPVVICLPDVAEVERHP